MQIIATQQASTEFVVSITSPREGQYRVLVQHTDDIRTLDSAQVATDLADAQAKANAVYAAIRNGSYEPKAVRLAREAAEAQVREDARHAAYEASFTDEALRQVVANPIPGAPGPSRRAEILLTVPLFARKAVSARSTLLRNLRGGIGSWNLQCAVNEFRELGGDEAAAVALEARSQADNAHAMGWAV